MIQPIKILYILVLLLASCKPEPPLPRVDPEPLKTALESPDPLIRSVVEQAGTHELQILFTRISREADTVILTDYGYRVDASNYFYPASTVKFPIALLALEHLNNTDTLELYTRFFVEGDTTVTTFAQDITRIFAVSDNAANNRLIEFLGQDSINRRLERKALGPVRIAHRLGEHDESLRTRPLLIYLNDSTTSPTLPTINTAPQPLELRSVEKGKGYYDEEVLYEGPFDFSLKNYYPLQTQHEVMKRVIFPERYPDSARFHLSRAQRVFLLDAMKKVPREAGYDPQTYYDSYCKFFLFGDRRDPIPDHIKIYNKVGFAYGTLTDCAYIQDTKSGVEFLLTATILVNSDGIFNDDAYEYDTVGIPFLAALGRELYNIELKRLKK